MEIWKDIIGYEGYYQFSNYARVRSIPRKVKMRGENNYRIARGQLIKIFDTNDGYALVHLSRKHKSKTAYIHRLMWEYVNNKAVPLGYDVNHIDGNVSNNAPENLNIMLHKDNCNQITKGKTPAQKRKETNPNYYKLGSKTQRKACYAIDKEGNYLFCVSTTQAGKAVGVSRASICYSIKHQSRVKNNWQWFWS